MTASDPKEWFVFSAPQGITFSIFGHEYLAGSDMNLRPLIFFMTFSLSATLSADGTDYVEEWKAVVGSMFAEELRRAHRDGFFANEWTDCELGQLISRISSEVASCWAKGYLSLAKSKSVSIDNIFIVSGGLHIDNDHFTHEEINEAMNHCVPAAFRSAAIEYKSGAAKQYERLIAFHDRIKREQRR